MSEVPGVLRALKMQIGRTVLLHEHPDVNQTYDAIAALPDDEQTAAAERWRERHALLIARVGVLARRALDQYRSEDPTDAVLVVINHWRDLVDDLPIEELDNVERLFIPIISQTISRRHNPEETRARLEALVAYANGE